MRKGLLISLVLSSILAAPVYAAPAKNGQAKGQQQQQGANGSFGAIYTMQNNFNLQLISARYTIEPHNDYNGTIANEGEKLLILTYAIKNASPAENYTGGYEFVAVDEADNNVASGSGTTKLEKNGSAEFSANLKPSQGIGQDPANRLTVAFVLPGKARIKKIMVKPGRKAVASEETLRFPIAGFADGVAANQIGALPPCIADPADKTGATALEVGKAELGKYAPGNYFSLRVDDVSSPAGAVYKGQPASAGNKFVVATFKARNNGSKKYGPFYFQDNAPDRVLLRDADGRKYHIVADSAARDVKRDQAVQEDELGPGEEMGFRYFFEVPSDTKVASIQFGGGGYGHAFRLDFPH